MLKISKLIKTPYFNKFEIDEMWSYRGDKKNVIWITYVLERESESIIDFFVCRKTFNHELIKFCYSIQQEFIQTG